MKSEDFVKTSGDFESLLHQSAVRRISGFLLQAACAAEHGKNFREAAHGKRPSHLFFSIYICRCRFCSESHSSQVDASRERERFEPVQLQGLRCDWFCVFLSRARRVAKPLQPISRNFWPVRHMAFAASCWLMSSHKHDRFNQTNCRKDDADRVASRL